MGSAESKPVVHIKQLELSLIKKLKQICNKKGREVDPLKSAPILHQLGTVYYLQGKQNSDPICLIQSAGLYNAAIVRSANNQHEIEQDLEKLCKLVLRKAGAKHKNADLIKQANIVKGQFETLR